MADPYSYGKNRGCSFIWFTQGTANSVYNKEEHCTSIDSYGCGTECLGEGLCGHNAYTGDYSNIYLERNGLHCHVTEEETDEAIFAGALQSRGRFNNSRCFNGNIYATGFSGVDYTYCFQYNCLNNN